MTNYVVIRSEYIETADEARDYYRAKFVGAHPIKSWGQPITIVFEERATHLYSSEIKDPTSSLPRVTRRLGPNKVETREFNVARAQLMDKVIQAVEQYTVSVPAAGGRQGAEKTVLYGRQLTGGMYMRVVLRPGPGEAWTCVSAYPVSTAEWRSARRLPRAKFPP